MKKLNFFPAALGAAAWFVATPAYAWYAGPKAVKFSYQYAPAVSSTLSSADDAIELKYMDGFVLPFYGTNYTNVYVSTNGFISFSAPSSSQATMNNAAFAYDGQQTGTAGGKFVCAFPCLIPLFLVPPPLTVAVWWDDWDPAQAGTIYYGRRSGEAYCGTGKFDCFIIEWWNVAKYGDTSGALYTFEVKLQSDGAIDMHYQTAQSASGTANGGISGTVGLFHHSKTVGHPYIFNTNTLQNMTAIRFVYPGNSAVYLISRDVFGAARADMYSKATVVCGDGFQYYAYATTDAAGKSRASISCATPPQTSWVQFLDPAGTGEMKDAVGNIVSEPAYGNSSLVYNYNDLVASWDPKAQIAYARLGSFTFARRNFLTPKQSARVSWPITYTYGKHHPTDSEGWVTSTCCSAGSLWTATYNSYLDTWTTDGVIDKPLVIVPGIDLENAIYNGTYPLGDSGADYFLLLAPALGKLLAQGYDIMIGDWGRGSAKIEQTMQDVERWINHAYNSQAAATKVPVQVAAVSLGGVVTRYTMAYSATAQGRTRAWYSLDAPHRGANLGGLVGTEPVNIRGGLRTIIACGEGVGAGANYQNYEKLWSPAAWQMSKFVPTYFNCERAYGPEKAPHNWSANFTRNDFVTNIPWNSAAYPRYAIANGRGPEGPGQPWRDAYMHTMVGVSGTNTNDALWAIAYNNFCVFNGWYARYDGSWDNMAGSKYISGVETYGMGVTVSRAQTVDDICPAAGNGLVSIYYRWEPAFINTASALNASGDPIRGYQWWMNPYVVPNGHWTDWRANSYNAWHREVPSDSVTKMVNWMTTGLGKY